MPDPIIVTAAVVEQRGTFLLTRRLEGTHLAGHWEFPGGKAHDGETLEDCLVREIREELDAAVDVGDEILATVHHYPDRSIELRFFRCTLLSEPHPMMGQEMQWVARADLGSIELPPADSELVRLLQRLGSDSSSLGVRLVAGDHKRDESDPKRL